MILSPLVFPAENIMAGWKEFPGTNALAYFASVSVEKVLNHRRQVGGTASTSLMSNSLPSYDLKKLFKAPEILQV
jgi:hypothetical protein